MLTGSSAGQSLGMKTIGNGKGGNADAQILLVISYSRSCNESVLETIRPTLHKGIDRVPAPA